MTSPASHPAPDDEPLGPVGPMTFEEYLEFEEASEVRHEFVNGYAYPMDVTAMSGGTYAHNQIIVNISGLLWLRTRGTGCRTHNQSFRLHTPGGRTYYPDLMVSCGPKPPSGALHLTDPCLAIEVLSPTTARTDVTEKWESYQEVPTLGAYLTVESTWRAVHRRWRGEDGEWRTGLVAGAGGAVPLPCPAGGVLTLDEIYQDTDLPPEAPTSPRLLRVREEMASYNVGAEYEAP